MSAGEQFLYDVVIVGAGPAGTLFAAGLAKSVPKLRIALIDGQSRVHKPCGGLLAPDAQKALAQLGLVLPRSVLSDPQIFAVETIDISQHCIRYYPRHYLNMDRYLFDRWLLSRVPGSVDIITGRCIAVSGCTGRFSLTVEPEERRGSAVRDRAAGTAQPSDAPNRDGILKPLTITAAAVVGADGAGSIVRRTFFGRRVPKRLSLQQWFDLPGEGFPYYSCIFDSEVNDSCSWTVRKGRYVVFGGAFKMNGARETFEIQKARVEELLGRNFGAPVRTEACLLVCPESPGDFVTGMPGVYLLGEAAGFVSASSFEGISSAIISAKMLADSFETGRDAGGIAREYRRRTRALRGRLSLKIVKRALLCSPLWRRLIMKSGVCSIQVEQSEGHVVAE